MSYHRCFDSYDADGLYETVRSSADATVTQMAPLYTLHNVTHVTQVRNSADATGAFGCYITSASLKDP